MASIFNSFIYISKVIAVRRWNFNLFSFLHRYRLTWAFLTLSVFAYEWFGSEHSSVINQFGWIYWNYFNCLFSPVSIQFNFIIRLNITNLLMEVKQAIFCNLVNVVLISSELGEIVSVLWNVGCYSWQELIQMFFIRKLLLVNFKYNCLPTFYTCFSYFSLYTSLWRYLHIWNLKP